MNTTRVTVTKVAKNFSDFINRVAYRGEHFILLKGRKEVAEISPVIRGRVLGELPEIFARLPKLSKEEYLAFSKDLEEEKKQSANEKLRDPWVS
jgi:antitoxin (DNA-binding transcriptional repressor) of toxin-antitoxin stability system